jgi:anti-sigma regulatory factor (Ser/Thr protein kinase)
MVIMTDPPESRVCTAGSTPVAASPPGLVSPGRRPTTGSRPHGRYVSAALAPVRESAAEARQLIRDFLAGRGLGHLSDDAELIVTEMVANAVAAVPPGSPDLSVILSAHLTPDAVRIMVWDIGPGEPVAGELVADHFESGRGLAIIAALASKGWGWWPTPAGGGKVVWVTLAAGPPAPSAPAEHAQGTSATR